MALFQIEFQPNSKAKEAGMVAQARRTYGPGWKAALSHSGKAFGLSRVRFVNHPGNPGVGTAYDADGKIVGQVTASRVGA